MGRDDFWKTYFEEAFEEPDPWAFSSSDYEQTRYLRLNWIIGQYHQSPNQILELGCAEGAHTEQLVEYFPEANVIAVDYMDTAISRARENIDSDAVEFVNSDYTNLINDINNKFDIVILSEAVYTLGDEMTVTNIYKFFKDIEDILKNSGILCISNVVGYESHDELGLLTERPLLQSYRKMLSELMDEIHYSEYQEYKRESDTDHIYQLMAFKK